MGQDFLSTNDTNYHEFNPKSKIESSCLILKNPIYPCFYFPEF